MKKVQVTGLSEHSDIQTANCMTNAGLKALDGIITEVYYIDSDSRKEIEDCIDRFYIKHPGFDTVQAILVE